MVLTLEAPSRAPSTGSLASTGRVEAVVALIDAKSPDARTRCVDALRMALAEGHAEAEARLKAGGKGRACVAALSDLEDAVIRAAARFCSVDRPVPTILAVGGYGRGMLAPGSDIDLLFLTGDAGAKETEKIVEAILYVLWDLKQKIGHATRSIDECLRRARADVTIRTTLLEARLIQGDAALFAKLQARFDREIVAKSAGEFVAAKLSERDERLKRSDASRYVVEPNVKEGKGGLRDLNTLFWIAKYVYRVSDAKALVGAGLFTSAEYSQAMRCEEFLWAVRCHLHFLTHRAEERLSFDLQPQIAERLGYVSRKGLSAVERFMKHYFLVAKDVGDLTAVVCAAMEERQTKPRTTLNRLFGGLRRRSRAIADAGDFRMEHGRITVAAPDVFERDPVDLIRLFWAADRANSAIHPDATRAAFRALRRIDANLRADPEANRLFLETLTSRPAPETALRLMNEAGVLGRFIPDFGRVVGMMQFNMYHHFTVDEHLIRTVGALAQIENGRLKEDHPLASEFLPAITNRRVLYVAAFLHDIAKGRDEDHSIAGARVARQVCPRLGLTPAETDTVAWLVEQHLTMSNMSQGRDLQDPKTAQALAAVVQTLERLRLLLILTVCDIRAVGPGVWNGWKGQLLRTLYWETEVVLTGGHSSIDRKARVDSAQNELRRSLPGWSDPDFDAYSQRHYPAYWLKTDLAHQKAHANLLDAMNAEVRSLASEVTTDAFRGVTELTIVAPDNPRLLSIIAGACAGAGGNIVDAQIFTTSDGLALDTISVSRAFDQDEDELRRGRRIAQAIEKTLRGEMRIGEMVADKTRKTKPSAFAVTPQVSIDNELSNKYTVVDVEGLDRPGLLYDLTSALSRLNLNIGSAHIVTFGEKAIDAFYVTDLTGAKISATARQAVVRRELTRALSPPGPET